MDEQKPDTDTAAPAITETPSSPTKPSTNSNGHARNGSAANGHAIPLHLKTETESSKSSDKDAAATDSPSHDRNGDRSAASTAPSTPTTAASKTTSPRAAMTQDGPEGEALHAELERLRKQVEELKKTQESHDEETEKLRSDLEESEAGREQAETQYQTIVVRVEKIKETLGSRFQRDKEELAEARDRIEDLEAQNESLLQTKADAEAATAAAANEVARLQQELDVIENEHDREHTEIRNRTQLSQQNWHREKQELMQQLESVKQELVSTRDSMNDWEVVALEERNKYTAMEDKVYDLEEQAQMLREQYQRAAADRDTQADAVDGLQRSLDDLQNARRHELREMVQESEAKLEAAEARAQKAERAAETAKEEAETLQKVVERTSTMEVELREKTAALGKLRHETISLHDHLVRALRFIKKMKPEEAVDKYVLSPSLIFTPSSCIMSADNDIFISRQVVTNLMIQFLQLDRSDPKKFQVLQVIAGMLQWTDEQKEKAGLARPGTASSSLRLPSSPFGRTPSTPSLNTEILLESTSSSVTGTGSKSLSSMFKAFLEESVNETASSAVAADDPLLAALINTKPSGTKLPDTKQLDATSPENKPSEAPPSEKSEKA